ncbi:glycosyltransferase [Liquorilactobacillus sucicola DSM 21376 = JCM 15457]|nr:glycosyltransferase [Liquorilactobacillus sucicola DSM 21376 = JCM 15457]
MLKYHLYQKSLQLLTIINPKWNVEVSYRHTMKSKINLKNPQTFNEKICWLKLYDYPKNKLVIRCTDKVEARDYIREKGLEGLLNEIYQVCDDPENIEFNKLPAEYVVKWGHDYGSTIICNSTTNTEKVKQKLKRLKHRKFYLNSAEMHYSKIKPKVIVEKLLKDTTQPELYDYKVFCYNGVPRFIMVCLGRQENNTKFYFFDTQWTFLRLNNDGKEAPKNFNIPKPVCFEEMLKDARKLSEDFKFVRVDFYIVNDKLVFSELTFSHAAGMDRDIRGSFDLLLGKYLTL